MKLLNLVNISSSLLVLPLVVNYALTGNILGRKTKRIPFGMIDTGKDTADGRAITVDPIQTLLLRRGLRITGAQKVISGITEKKEPGEIALGAGWDILQGILHPWAGAGG